MADEKMIITIGREHGTMGDRVAEKIRRQFELPLYDKAHLLRVVEGTDDYDELNAFFNDRKVNSLLYAIAMSENVSSNEVPFGIIKKIIGNTGGVVMDSCGNYLFRERPNTVRIFMHADKNIRIKNLMKYLGISKELTPERPVRTVSGSVLPHQTTAKVHYSMILTQSKNYAAIPTRE